MLVDIEGYDVYRKVDLLRERLRKAKTLQELFFVVFPAV